MLSVLPLSLLLINWLSKIFSKHDPELGNTTTICTNLTGTLTKDSLMVRTIFFDKYKTTLEEEEARFLKIEDTEEKDKFALVEKSTLQKDEVLKWMSATTALCPFKKLKEIEEIIGNLFIKFGLSKLKVINEFEIIDKVPAISEKKFSTTIVLKKDTQEIFALTKGNPLYIIKKCTKTFIGGKKVDINRQMRRKIQENIKKLNLNGQKAIGFALKPLPKKRQKIYSEAFAEREMTFLGMVGITSPLNEAPKKSIEAAKKAGIKIYILTGEKERKAVAIGKLLGLINPHYFEAMSGDYFRHIPEPKLAKMLENKDKDYVFSELNHEDKNKIMKILKNHGQTIAVVNNNFDETIEGIQHGRAVNLNHKKFTQHALSCKIAEFILIASALIFQAPVPLSMLLILILDVTINVILELSLRADYVEEDVMTKNYIPEKTFSQKSLYSIILRGATSGIILSAVYIWGLMRNGWMTGEQINPQETMFISATTITFVLLSVMQIISALELKNPKKSIIKTNVFRPPYLILTSIISILLIYFLATFDPLQKFLNLSGINAIEWQIILFSGLLVLLIEELKKSLLKKFQNANPSSN